ncbi:polyketide antibiotic transporter [Citricoccus sp. SGAir0253]|uniref:ABC transporter permease n=1 Tax=Citricoccus sp. SGAir0253 TaxID=2567881 RepID=UPI0010CCB7F5|nr:polyketide antibiotic transporter [Citricoccus sp. SGAir0253]QCU78217.1 polyketide antibiotic transporter [Citricoccus sp. SGAir0253]
MSGLLPVLLRQRLRRDRIQLLLWILGTGALALSGQSGVAESYGTPQDRQTLVALALANPVILVFRGLPSGTSEGAFLAFLLLPWLAILAALMSVFLAVRHTRGDEDAGRTELLSSTPAGRTLPTLATLVHGVAANAALGLASAGALAIGDLEVDGALLCGAAAAATGVVFLGAGLLAAQVMPTARGANSLAVWVLLGTFLLAGLSNAVGTPSSDLSRMDSAWPVWLSPFGWAEQTRPFDADRWWPLALSVACALVLSLGALALQSTRDVGASLVAARDGRATARRGLSSPSALTWRLAAGSVLGWAAGGAVVGILATTLGRLVDQIAGQNTAVEHILERIAGAGALEEAVVTTFFTFLGILAACSAVQTVVRARQAEVHGTAEPVLSTPTGRARWLAGYLAVATGAVLIVVAAALAAAYLGLAASGGAESLYRVVTVAGLGQVVAASVFTVLAALAFVLVPRATLGVAWGLVLVATVLGMFGPLLGLPEWTADLSPFAQSPVTVGGEVDVRGLWWLLAVVAAGSAAALVLMRRRELAGAG